MTTHRTLLLLPLALSNIFGALTAHLSLSLAVYVYIYILQPMTTHHTLLSLPLPLSLTYFKHLQRISISLSLHSQNFTNDHTPPLAPFRSR